MVLTRGSKPALLGRSSVPAWSAVLSTENKATVRIVNERVKKKKGDGRDMADKIRAVAVVKRNNGIPFSLKRTPIKLQRNAQSGNEKNTVEGFLLP